MVGKVFPFPQKKLGERHSCGIQLLVPYQPATPPHLMHSQLLKEALLRADARTWQLLKAVQMGSF